MLFKLLYVKVSGKPLLSAENLVVRRIIMHWRNIIVVVKSIKLKNLNPSNLVGKFDALTFIHMV